MPLITLNIPHQKMPILKEFIEVIGLNDNSIKTAPTHFVTKSYSNSRQDLPTFQISTIKGWESFSNELEFE